MDPEGGSNTGPEGETVERPAPARRTGGRGPKRRRWTLPVSPAERTAEPVDPPPPTLYPCPHCCERHQPVPLPADLLGRALGRDRWWHDPMADTTSMVRDHFSPWR